MRVKLLVWAFLSILLTACGQVSKAEPLPTPSVLQVQVSPALNWLAPNLNLCTGRQKNFGLSLNMATALSPDTQPDIFLYWGDNIDTQGSPAFIIGDDALLVIRHPQNPVEQLSLEQLYSLLTTSTATWDQILPGVLPDFPVQPWIYSSGKDIHKNLSAWFPQKELLFPNASLGPDPQAVRQSVGSNPGALGVIPGRWLDSSVRTINIQDLPPDKARFPILAILKTNPDENLKTWLNCLQITIMTSKQE